jgi:hypothetical protein
VIGLPRIISGFLIERFLALGTIQTSALGSKLMNIVEHTKAVATEDESWILWHNSFLEDLTEIDTMGAGLNTTILNVHGTYVFEEIEPRE